MGRPGSNQSATKTIPYQKGCRRRPTHADRLRQGPHHHLRKARQEGREIPRQGPAVPVHIACTIRAQHGHAGRRGMEHPRRLPARNAAAGHQKGTFLFLRLSRCFARRAEYCFRWAPLLHRWKSCFELVHSAVRDPAFTYNASTTVSHADLRSQSISPFGVLVYKSVCVLTLLNNSSWELSLPTCPPPLLAAGCSEELPVCCREVSYPRHTGV